MNRKLFAGSRTKFTCACKQLLDYCPKMLLSFWFSKFVILKVMLQETIRNDHF